jgi:hypothetical protein
MNWKRCESKQSWLNWGAIPTFASRDRRKPQRAPVGLDGSRFKIWTRYVPNIELECKTLGRVIRSLYKLYTFTFVRKKMPQKDKLMYRKSI